MLHANAILLVSTPHPAPLLGEQTSKVHDPHCRALMEQSQPPFQQLARKAPFHTHPGVRSWSVAPHGAAPFGT